MNKDESVLVIGGGGRSHLWRTAEILSEHHRLFGYLTGGYPKGVLSRFAPLLGTSGVRLMNRRANISNGRVKSFWFFELFWLINQRLSAYQNKVVRRLQKMISALMLHIFSIQMLIWIVLRRNSLPKFAICRSGFGGIALLYLKKKNVQVIVDHSIPHPSFLVQAGLDSPSDRFQGIINRDLANADLIIVNSEFVKQTFLEAGFSHEKIFVIYLEVDSIFLNQKRERSLSNIPRVLFVGTVSIRKGALELVNILSSSARVWPMTIVGDWSGKAKFLQRRVAEMNNVDIVPTVSRQELIKIILDHDVLLFPTRAEGSARIVSEAMATGMPVITTKYSGAPGVPGVHWLEIDIYKNTPGGGQLADTINAMLANKTELNRIGLQGRELINVYHNDNKYEVNLLEILTALETRD